MTHAEQRGGLDLGQARERRARIGLIAEQLGQLGRGRAVDARGDLRGLARAHERAREHPIEAHVHAPERFGHPRVLAPPRVGERAPAVVGPAARIRLARLAVAHQDQEHGDYYRTSSAAIGCSARPAQW